MRLLIDRVEVRVPRGASRARGERLAGLVTGRLGAALGRPVSGAPRGAAPGHDVTGEPTGPRSERGGGGAADGS